MALTEVTIRSEGDKVLWVIGGKAHTIPYAQAFEIARGLYIKAQEAEEFACANRIIADGALLTRLGVPVGLTNNPKMKDEIGKEAAWNTELRRALPGGVKARAVVGTPSVVRSNKQAQTISAGAVQSQEGFGRIGGR